MDLKALRKAARRGINPPKAMGDEIPPCDVCGKVTKIMTICQDADGDTFIRCIKHVPDDCKICNGEGTCDIAGVETTCLKCNGTGWDRRCDLCGGSGRIPVAMTPEVQRTCPNCLKRTVGSERRRRRRKR